MKMIHEGRITRNPAVMVGKPCIKGTRITVELILERLIQGATAESILYDYDHLTKEDMHALIMQGQLWFMKKCMN